jgi:hypothetical protein
MVTMDFRIPDIKQFMFQAPRGAYDEQRGS